MLGPQHAAAMYEIERQCFPLPWSEEQCAAAFGQKAFSALGLFRNEALIGYISVYHTLDELEILNLAVLPHERRRGYGSGVRRRERDGGDDRAGHRPGRDGRGLGRLRHRGRGGRGGRAGGVAGIGAVHGPIVPCPGAWPGSPDNLGP